MTALSIFVRTNVGRGNLDKGVQYQMSKLI